MPTIIQVPCPGCQHTLRIPDEWMDRQIRCKHCQLSFCPRTSLSAPAEPPAPGANFAFGSGDTVQDDDFPPASVPSGDALAFDKSAPPGPAGASHYKPRGRSWGKPIAAGFFVLLVAAAGGIGFFYTDLFGKSGETTPTPPGDEPPAKSGTDVVKTPTPPTKPGSKSAKATDLPSGLADNFPRRMLYVGVNNYVYANPTSGGRGGRGTIDAARLFAISHLKVPRDQFYVLSDSLPDKDARPPLKPIIEQTVERFLSTCRAQDRIILTFAGHALDIDDQPYFVPLDGELTVKDTLIPLKWLYDRLATCPARQKLLVMDVCRFDPDRGLERPGSGPMGAKLDAMLKSPPPGAQVLSACVEKQYSLETDFAQAGPATVTGGVFIGVLTQAFQKGGGIQKPEEPLPVDFLVKALNPVTTVAKVRGLEQTPRLSGAEAADGAAFDASQPMPPRFELPRPDALLAGGRADVKEVASIFAEVVVPPLRLPRDAEKIQATPEQVAQHLAAMFPFQAETIKAYPADYANVREVMEKKDQYPLRVAVIRAVEALDRQGRLNKVRIGTMDKNTDRLIEEFKGTTTDDVKKSLTGTQKGGPALMEEELKEVHEALMEAEKNRAKEPSKRWQANFDYVLAQVKARWVYVQEYNTVIAKVKKDELPALNPAIHKGWRLSPQEKIQSPKEYKDLASESKKLYAKIVKEYPGTPWEVLAKRERFTSLGLSWQPASFAGE